jgi:hypothetical protein
MTLQHRLYATMEGCSDHEAAQELLQTIGTRLDGLYDRGAIAGYKLLVLAGEDDYEDEDLDRLAIERETRGRFPCLFLNVTYRDTPPPDMTVVDAVVAEYKFGYLTESADQ